jgi:hypothetical protein
MTWEACYARHFEHCTGERYRMEATPGYFGGGRPVATAMRDTLYPSLVLAGTMFLTVLSLMVLSDRAHVERNRATLL